MDGWLCLTMSEASTGKMGGLEVIQCLSMGINLKIHSFICLAKLGRPGLLIGISACCISMWLHHPGPSALGVQPFFNRSSGF